MEQISHILLRKFTLICMKVIQSPKEVGDICYQLTIVNELMKFF